MRLVVSARRCRTLIAAGVILGAVMPAPRWAIGGGMTHVVHPRGSRLIEDVRCEAVAALDEPYAPRGLTPASS
jgi:hypothetical protein